MFLSVITAPIVFAQLIDFLIRRCNVNRIIILQIRSATPIQDMNMSAPIYCIGVVMVSSYWSKFATLRLIVETMPIYKAVTAGNGNNEFLQRNNTFKFKITLDRHNAIQNLNYYVLPGPPLFSLPSTFKVQKLF